jgi:hypothetical protein
MHDPSNLRTVRMFRPFRFFVAERLLKGADGLLPIGVAHSTF